VISVRSIVAKGARRGFATLTCQDFDAIRGLLFTRENMEAETSTEGPVTALGPDKPKPPPTVGDDYHELVSDERSQLKDPKEDRRGDCPGRKGSARRARLRRMMGEEDEETDEEGERR